MKSIAQATVKAQVFILLYLLILNVPSITRLISEGLQMNVISSEFYVSGDTDELESDIKNTIAEIKLTGLITVHKVTQSRNSYIRLEFKASDKYVPGYDHLIGTLSKNDRLMLKSLFSELVVPPIQKPTWIMFLLLILSAAGWWKYSESKEIKNNFVLASLPHAVFVSAFITVVLIVFIQIIAYIFHELGFEINGDVQGIKSAFENNALMFITLAVLIAPVTEELFFKGIVYRFFLDKNLPLIGALFVETVN